MNQTATTADVSKYSKNLLSKFNKCSEHLKISTINGCVWICKNNQHAYYDKFGHNIMYQIQNHKFESINDVLFIVAAHCLIHSQNSGGVTIISK